MLELPLKMGLLSSLGLKFISYRTQHSGSTLSKIVRLTIDVNVVAKGSKISLIGYIQS